MDKIPADALPDELFEVIRNMERAAVAASLRFQATSARSLGDLLHAQARTLEDTADRIQRGEEEPPDAPVRLQVVREEAVEEEPEEPEGPGPVFELTKDSDDRFVLTRDGQPPDQAQLEWLDLFDDRIRGQAQFLAAVNEAAERELPLDEDTARLVAARTRELAEAAARPKDGSDG